MQQRFLSEMYDSGRADVGVLHMIEGWGVRKPSDFR